MICFPVYGATNCEITLAFRSCRFPTWPKSQDKTLKTHKNKNNKAKWKTFFIIIKGLLVAINYLRHESGTLSLKTYKNWLTIFTEHKTNHVSGISRIVLIMSKIEDEAFSGTRYRLRAVNYFHKNDVWQDSKYTSGYQPIAISPFLLVTEIK